MICSLPVTGRSRAWFYDSLMKIQRLGRLFLCRQTSVYPGRRSGAFQLASPITNLAAARAAVTNWADVLLTALNHAKESSSDTAATGK